jgi:vancomycin resistance protein YoaR
MDEYQVLKKRKIKLMLLEGFLVFLILLLGSAIYLLSYQKSYSGKIYPNTQFGDLNLGGQSNAEAAKVLENYNKKIGLQKITISSGSKTTEVTFADAGTTLDIEKMLATAYATGRSSNFFSGIYASASTIYQPNDIKPVIKTDQAKFSALIDKISADLAEKAADASIAMNAGQAVITPSKKGQTIDRNDLINQISQIISTQKSRAIVAKTIYADPAVVESTLVSAKTKADSYTQKSATLTALDQSFTLTSAQISDMISFPKDTSGNINATIDTNKIAAYVANTLAKKIDIAKVDQKVSSTDQSVISAGSDGRHVDRSDAQAKIKAFLGGSNQTTVIALSVIGDAFGTQTVFPDEGIVAGRFPGKYIDVDLTHQQMHLFEGTNLIAQYPVSTGKWSTPTPIGTRYIINKDPRAWSSPYGLWMPWWNGIGNGYGIHELPEWPSGKKEGEDHLGDPVSDGCIRLGIGAAQTVYNWTEIGIPVYIHK